MSANSAGKRQSPQQSLKVLAISGSLRKASVSTSFLKGLALQEYHDIALSVRTLEGIPLYNEDLDTDPPLASIAILRDEVRSSDGVVIATPEYNHGVPGVLKNALDWASRPAFASCFRDKPVLIITSAPGGTGGVRAQYQLRETLVSMLAHVVPGREILLAGAASHLVEGRLTDANTLRVLERGLQALRQEIRLRRAEGEAS